MRLWTRAEANEIDKLSATTLSSSEELMEEAGLKVAEFVISKAQNNQSIVILAGPGNNGGDAYVAAKILHNQGFQVSLIEIPADKHSNLNQKKKSEFISARGVIKSWRADLSADLWIDGLFGINLTRNLDQEIEALILRVNKKSGIKIAIDTPSGLDVDSGEIYSEQALRADFTLTFGAAKPGFYLNHGPAVCGKIICVPLSFTEKALRYRKKSVFLMSPYLAKKWLPVRSPTANKSHGGRCLIIAGSENMPGAGILACRAALRSGAGYVYASSPVVLDKVPEAISWQGEKIQSLVSALLGPGLGLEKDLGSYFSQLKNCNSVIDADAITWLSKKINSLKYNSFTCSQNWVLTPHAGELSRLIDLSPQEIEKDRIAVAQLAQKKLGCLILLKGFHSVLALPKFSVIIPTGNVALAKGGSGDVLAGMIAGFMAQKLDPTRATLLAAFIHGWIADQWVKDGNDYLSLTPSDLLNRLPHFIEKLRH